MDKTYISAITNRAPKARSKRLRDIGAGTSGGTVVLNGTGGGGTTSTGSSHTHSNLNILEQISTDNNGYGWLTQIREVINGDTTVNQTVTEKIKAGYADMAFDLTEDSPVRHRFLSRIDDDTAQGAITFEKWIEFGQYLAGSGGAFLGMTEAGSLGEMDYLKVRKKAQFETLEIAEVRYVGGKLVVSPGDGVEIIAVEDLTDGYKCYYKGSETDADGHTQKVNNKFAVGDQIYCKVSNVTEGVFVNHYWWRLCIDTGDGWFTLSKTDCDYGSDAPLIGDKCAQLGNHGYGGTEADPTRQSAIVLSTVEIGHSPLLALYGGIDSYSLDSKDQVAMGADADGVPFMTVYGKMYIGTRNESTYIRYTPNNGVEIKANISAESSIGGSSLDDYVKGTVMGDIADDGKLTPIEKRQLLTLLLGIRQEYADLSAKCESKGIGYAAYDTAYWNLVFWLTGETKEPIYLLLEDGARLLLENGGGILLEHRGVLYDMNSTSEIDRDAWLELLRAYYAELDALNLDRLYGDYTKTVIDGGLITTGTIELKGASDTPHAGITGNESGGADDVRIWAGSGYQERNTAPFRVTESGRLTASDADIKGAITADSITLGNGSAIVAYNEDQGVILPKLSGTSVRSIEIWIIGGNVYFTHDPNESVKIGENIDFSNESDFLSSTHDEYVLTTGGMYKALGFNIVKNNMDTTFWNIVKYDMAYSIDPTKFGGKPCDHGGYTPPNVLRPLDHLEGNSTIQPYNN